MLQGTKEIIKTLEKEGEMELLGQLYTLLNKIGFKSNLVALKPHSHRKNLAPVNYLLEFLDVDKEKSSDSSKSDQEADQEEVVEDEAEDPEAAGSEVQEEEEEGAAD